MTAANVVGGSTALAGAIKYDPTCELACFGVPSEGCVTDGIVVSLYTVTIEPCNGDGAATGSATAVIRVDTGRPKPRITEMTLQSSASAGLTYPTLPTIDLAGVVEALQSGVAPAEASPHKQEVADEMEPRGSSADAADHAETNQGNIEAAVVETDKHSPDRGSGRIYRRMPEAEELAATYERIGTVTGVAKHYGVPRHTAQGWMTRLRKLNGTPPSSKPKSQRT